MIKCNVTVCGTVSRQAQMRANKEGTQFASFGINIVIPAKSGINKTVEISVAKTCNSLSELPPIQVGTHIEVAGILMFHKREKHYTLTCLQLALTHSMQAITTALTVQWSSEVL